eukprot:gene9084-6377_t
MNARGNKCLPSDARKEINRTASTEKGAHVDPQLSLSNQGPSPKDPVNALGAVSPSALKPNWAVQHFLSLSDDDSVMEVEALQFYPCESVLQHSRSKKENSEPWKEYDLSEEEFNQLVSIFMTFDEGFGVLNKPRFERLCLFLNYTHSSRDSDYLFQEVDAKKKGVIDLHDFCSWFSTNSPGAKESYGLDRYQYNKLVLQFRGCDIDNVGVISHQQFRHLCLITGMTTSKYQEEYLLHLLRRHGCRTTVSLRDFLALYRDIQEKKSRNEPFFLARGPKRHQLQSSPPESHAHCRLSPVLEFSRIGLSERNRGLRRSAIQCLLLFNDGFLALKLLMLKATLFGMCGAPTLKQTLSTLQCDLSGKQRFSVEIVYRILVADYTRCTLVVGLKRLVVSFITPETIGKSLPCTSASQKDSEVLVAPHQPESADKVNNVVLRSLVAPLNPFGIGHLIYNTIWPAFLAAESAARKVGEKKKSAAEEDEPNDQDSETYAICMSNLSTAIAKARNMVLVLELYSSQSHYFGGMNVFTEALKATGGQPLPLNRYTTDSEAEVVDDSEGSLVTVERHNIFDAVQHDSQFQLLVTLLLGGASPTSQRESDRATPLHVAIINNPTKIIPNVLMAHFSVIDDVPCPNQLIMGFLIDNGADVNAKAQGDETPLIVAAACHNLRAIRLLIQKGADIDARDKTGRSCFSYGAPYPSVMMTFKDLLGESRFMAIANEQHLLHQVCHRPGCKFSALYLIEQLGMDVNASAHHTSHTSTWHTVRDGFTPLHCAVTAGDLEMTKALVSAGADVTKSDAFGITAVELACNSTVADVRSSRDDSFGAGVPIDPRGIRSFLLRYRSYSSPARREALATADPVPTFFSALNLAQFLFAATIPHFVMCFAVYFISSFLLLLGVMVGIFMIIIQMFYADQSALGKAPYLSQRPLRGVGALLGFIVVEGVCLPLYSTWIFYQTHNFEYHFRWPLLYWVIPSIIITFLSLFYIILRHPGDVKSTAGQRKGIYANVEKFLREGKTPKKDFLYSIDWSLMIRKPMRAQRCPQTNRLILRFDRFAPLVASPIGAKNHRAYIFFQFVLVVLFSGCYYYARAYNHILSTAVDTICENELRCSFNSKEQVSIKEVLDIMFSTPYFRFGYMYTQVVLPLVLLALVYGLVKDVLNISSNLTSFDCSYGDTHSSLYCFKLEDRVYSLYDRGVLRNLADFFLLRGDLAALEYRPPALPAALKKKVEDFQKTEILLNTSPCCDETHSHHHAAHEDVPSTLHVHQDESSEGKVTTVTMTSPPDQLRIQQLFQELIQTGGTATNPPCPPGVPLDEWEQTKEKAMEMYRLKPPKTDHILYFKPLVHYYLMKCEKKKGLLNIRFSLNAAATMSDTGPSPSSATADANPSSSAYTLHSATQSSGLEWIGKGNWRTSELLNGPFSDSTRRESPGALRSSSMTAGDSTNPLLSCDGKLNQEDPRTFVGGKSSYRELLQKSKPVQLYRPPHAREGQTASQPSTQSESQGKNGIAQELPTVSPTSSLGSFSRRRWSAPERGPSIETAVGHPSESSAPRARRSDSVPSSQSDSGDDAKGQAGPSCSQGVKSSTQTPKEESTPRASAFEELSETKNTDGHIHSDSSAHRMTFPLPGSASSQEKSDNVERGPDTLSGRGSLQETISLCHSMKSDNPMTAKKGLSKSPRTSTFTKPNLHQQHFQHSSPTANKSPSGGVSPSNQLSRGGKNHAWIQTDPFPNGVQESALQAGSYYGNRYDGTYGFTTAVSRGGGADQWMRTLDHTYVQVMQSPFLEMLPHYVDCCICVKKSEREARTKVFEDVQVAAKSKFGIKADVRVYGSVVTDLALPFSDVDILVAGYQPLSPLEAIHMLSATLLEIDEDALAQMREQIAKCEDENEESEDGMLNEDNPSRHDPADHVHLPSQANTSLLSSTGGSAEVEADIGTLPDSARQEEQYSCSEDVETAEEDFRHQILKDYTFSNWCDYRRLFALFSLGISAPTALSKGTNTDTTPVSLLPKIASGEAFEQDTESKGGGTDSEGSTTLSPEEVKSTLHTSTGPTEDMPKVEPMPEGTKPISEMTSKGATPDAKSSLSSPSFVPSAVENPPSRQTEGESGLPGAAGNRSLPSYYTYIPTLDGPLYRVQTITSARVPVIKITHRKLNQRADITFGGGEHYRSLQMTKNLLDTFPHARPLIRFLKQCVARWEINEAVPGGITSFAIYLMVKHMYNMVLDFHVRRLIDEEAQASAAANAAKNTGASPCPENDTVDTFMNVCGGRINSEGGTCIDGRIRSFLGTEPQLHSLEQGEGSHQSKVGHLSGEGNAANRISQMNNTAQPQQILKEGSDTEESSAYHERAAAHIRDNITLSTVFRDFCYYYGCFFNYESQGIRFCADGKSEVIAKPHICVRRGQLFHMTSPFDPEYDVTARMTCMRDFQWMCEIFFSTIIPGFSFSFFLQWFSPNTAATDATAVRDFLAGKGSQENDSALAGVVQESDEAMTNETIPNNTEHKEQHAWSSLQDRGIAVHLQKKESAEEEEERSDCQSLRVKKTGCETYDDDTHKNTGEDTSSGTIAQTDLGPKLGQTVPAPVSKEKGCENASRTKRSSNSSLVPPGTSTLSNPVVTASLGPSNSSSPTANSLSGASSRTAMPSNYRAGPSAGFANGMYAGMGSPVSFMTPMHSMRFGGSHSRAGQGYFGFYDPNLLACQMAYQQQMQSGMMDSMSIPYINPSARISSTSTGRSTGFPTGSPLQPSQYLYPGGEGDPTVGSASKQGGHHPNKKDVGGRQNQLPEHGIRSRKGSNKDVKQGPHLEKKLNSRSPPKKTKGKTKAVSSHETLNKGEGKGLNEAMNFRDDATREAKNLVSGSREKSAKGDAGTVAGTGTTSGPDPGLHSIRSATKAVEPPGGNSISERGRTMGGMYGCTLILFYLSPAHTTFLLFISHFWALMHNKILMPQKDTNKLLTDN